MSGGGTGFGGGLAGQKSPTGLVVLPELATTNLHLVADDWSGSGNWQDRSTSGNHAVLVGSPTRAASTKFLGRYAITTPASAGFHAPGDLINVSAKRTYEIILNNYGTGTNQEILSRNDTATSTQKWQVFFKNSVTLWGSALFNSVNGLYLGGSGSIASASGLPVFVTITVDLPATTMKLYHNGVLTFTDTTISGSLGSPAAIDLGIGGIWTQDTATLTTTPFNGSFLEIMRHSDALDAATIAIRSARFNALKGY